MSALLACFTFTVCDFRLHLGSLRSCNVLGISYLVHGFPHAHPWQAIARFPDGNTPPVAMSQEQDFNQKVADSDPWRTEQARELDEYIRKIAADSSRMAELFKPDYSSIQAFEKSAEPLRNAFCDSIGYPPPGSDLLEQQRLRGSVRTRSVFTIAP